MTKFYIILESNEKFLIEINFNLKMYTIKKGYLCRGFKRLGKIVRIEECPYL